MMKVLQAAFAFAIIALLLAVGIWSASAKGDEHRLKLLAVSEDGKGLTAEMTLKVAAGSGEVFIEAEPVTKLDTRISTGLAKEIACESLGIADKCRGSDFFFRIDANASLIGGPSAGAAAAALSAAAVEGLGINQSIAVTGTINSGGLVGEVGGLKQKIDAAAHDGITTVLIPVGERRFRPSNKSSALDLVEYGRSIGIDVVEVSDIRDVLFYLTGKNYSSGDASLEIDGSYSAKMGELASGICRRSQELLPLISEAELDSLPVGSPQEPGILDGSSARKIRDAARNMSSEGLAADKEGSHYSAASLCFGANVRLSYLSLLRENLSVKEAMREINSTGRRIDIFEGRIPEAESIAGLQVRGTVKDRLQEARELLKLSSGDLGNGDYSQAIYRLAFAQERLGSAEAWNQFMGSRPHGRSSYAIRRDSLQKGCTTRIQEAEDYIQYLETYLPGILKSSELSPIYAEMRAMDYSTCIFSASLVKARASAMLSALGGSENLSMLIDRKLEAAKSGIVRQTRNGEFPIVSYSYYEYAGTLKGTDEPSALLFSEYALELSNLNIYIDGVSTAGRAGQDSTADAKGREAVIGFAIGFAAGLAAAVLLSIPLTGIIRKKRRPIVLVKSRKR